MTDRWAQGHPKDPDKREVGLRKQAEVGVVSFEMRKELGPQEHGRLQRLEKAGSGSPWSPSGTSRPTLHFTQQD